MIINKIHKKGFMGLNVKQINYKQKNYTLGYRNMKEKNINNCVMASTSLSMTNPFIILCFAKLKTKQLLKRTEQDYLSKK